MFTQLSALAVVSLSAGWLIVSYFAGDGDVWEGKNLRLHTQSVRIGERISFTLDLKANESCPGEVVTVMTSSTNNGPPATVTFRRPVMRPGISVNDATGFIQLPESVTLGRWHVVHGIESRCTKRTKFDTTAEFDITVIP